jgi:hypothetical protein
MAGHGRVRDHLPHRPGGELPALGAGQATLAQRSSDGSQRPARQHLVSGPADRLGLLRDNGVRLDAIHLGVLVAKGLRARRLAQRGLLLQRVHQPHPLQPDLVCVQHGLDSTHHVTDADDAVPPRMQLRDARRCQLGGQLEPAHLPPLQPRLLHRPDPGAPAHRGRPPAAARTPAAARRPVLRLGRCPGRPRPAGPASARPRTPGPTAPGPRRPQPCRVCPG